MRVNAVGDGDRAAVVWQVLEQGFHFQHEPDGIFVEALHRVAVHVLEADARSINGQKRHALAAKHKRPVVSLRQHADPVVELEMRADQMFVVVVVPHHDFLRAIHFRTKLCR